MLPETPTQLSINNKCCQQVLDPLITRCFPFISNSFILVPLEIGECSAETIDYLNIISFKNSFNPMFVLVGTYSVLNVGKGGGNLDL